MLRKYGKRLPPLGQLALVIDVPAIERSGWGDHNALSVVGAAFVDDADLIYRMGVAGGDQLVVGSDQALSSGEGAELGAGLEAVAVHGVIGLWLGAGLVVLGASR